MSRDEEKTVAIIGCGTVGRNWALLFLRAGWRVRVFDPDPLAEEKMRRLFQQAQAEILAFEKVQDTALSFHKGLSEVVQGAVWIQESAPDRLDLKRQIYHIVQAHSQPSALIASSSETLTSADIQASATRAKYMLVIRPLSAGFTTEKVGVLEGPLSPLELLAQLSEFLKTLGLDPRIILA
ncbi:3-hydroxyacyl-CoA dehydrogenase NAD-binding domain-containing protein [Falsihalocynthiibacter sp. S25ZX9]|uniref:3-hydroxyacyl-CoA dehydrogenase NAD-binding domain-containing protein n=1 Tax=Falsihalocynthiibacter sp. S25ZX9 TaxID=3240870 RepID=UPI00351064D1